MLSTSSLGRPNHTPGTGEVEGTAPAPEPASKGFEPVTGPGDPPIPSAPEGSGSTVAGVPIEVLHPPRESAARAPNERCLVLRAGPPGSRVLIPADLESVEEDALLASGADLAADALIVGHHGASRGTGRAFLEAVRPRIAVVSAGLGNRFGHPAASVLARLRSRLVPVYRTDLDGQVRLRGKTTGFSVEITRKAGGE